MELNKRQKHYNEALGGIGYQLIRLGAYYEKRYGWFGKDILDVPEDFPLDAFIEETRTFLDAVETKQRALGDAIRKNHPDVMRGKRKDRRWKWPGLVGCSFDQAVEAIKTDSSELCPQKIGPGDSYVEAYYPRRVIVIVDENDMVLKTPTNG